MMFGKIEYSILKIDTFVSLDEGMDVLPAVLVILLCDHIFHDGVLLTQVLQYHLRLEVTSGVSQEPAFSLDRP